MDWEGGTEEYGKWSVPWVEKERVQEKKSQNNKKYNILGEWKLYKKVSSENGGSGTRRKE